MLLILNKILLMIIIFKLLLLLFIFNKKKNQLYFYEDVDIHVFLAYTKIVFFLYIKKYNL